MQWDVLFCPLVVLRAVVHVYQIRFPFTLHVLLTPRACSDPAHPTDTRFAVEVRQRLLYDRENAGKNGMVHGWPPISSTERPALAAALPQSPALLAPQPSPLLLVKLHQPRPLAP